MKDSRNAMYKRIPAMPIAMPAVVDTSGNTFPVAIQVLPSDNYYLLINGKTTKLVKPFLKK